MKKVICINANKSCFLKQGEIYEVDEVDEGETYIILSGELTGLIFIQSRFEEVKE